MPSPKTVAQLDRLQRFGAVYLEPSWRASPSAVLHPERLGRDADDRRL